MFFDLSLLTLFVRGGGHNDPPFDFLKIAPKPMILHTRKFLTSSFYPLDVFWKKIQLNRWCPSYYDVIVKNGSINFTVSS